MTRAARAPTGDPNEGLGPMIPRHGDCGWPPSSPSSMVRSGGGRCRWSGCQAVSGDVDRLARRAGRPRRTGRPRAPSGRRSWRPAAASARSRRGGRDGRGCEDLLGGPSATTSPSRMTTTRPKRDAANSMSWVIATTVRPASRSPRPRRRRERHRRRPDRSSARRGRGPPGPSRGRRPARPACAARGRGRTGWSSVPRAGRRRSGCWSTRSAISRRRTPRFLGPNATSRSTDRSKSCSSGFWKTNPTVAASSAIEPAVGRLPVEDDPPLGRAEEAVEVLHEGRLARAVLTEDRDRFARLDGQRHAADGLDAARVAVDEVLDGRSGRAAGPRSGSRPARPRIRRARSAGSRSRIADRAAEWPRSPASPAAIAASSKAAAESMPAASARRTIVGGAGRPRGRRRQAPRPARRARRPSRVEHQAAVHPTEDGRVVFGTQDRRPGPRQLVEEVGDRRGPRRVELGRRFVEDQDVGAHRHDARDGHALLFAAGQGERLTVGEVADRQAGERGIDPSVHLVARHAQVLEAERELLADGLLRGRQLVGRCREDDPDLAEERARRRRRRVRRLR